METWQIILIIVVCVIIVGVLSRLAYNRIVNKRWFGGDSMKLYGGDAEVLGIPPQHYSYIPHTNTLYIRFNDPGNAHHNPDPRDRTIHGIPLQVQLPNPYTGGYDVVNNFIQWHNDRTNRNEWVLCVPAGSTISQCSIRVRRGRNAPPEYGLYACIMPLGIPNSMWCVALDEGPNANPTVVNMSGNPNIIRIDSQYVTCKTMSNIANPNDPFLLRAGMAVWNYCVACESLNNDIPILVPEYKAVYSAEKAWQLAQTMERPPTIELFGVRRDNRVTINELAIRTPELVDDIRKMVDSLMGKETPPLSVNVPLPKIPNNVTQDSAYRVDQIMQTIVLYHLNMDDKYAREIAVHLVITKNELNLHKAINELRNAIEADEAGTAPNTPTYLPRLPEIGRDIGRGIGRGPVFGPDVGTDVGPTSSGSTVTDSAGGWKRRT